MQPVAKVTLHITSMCQVTLATGCIVSYAYIMEFIIAWYSGSAMEKFHFMNRALGPMWWGWVMMMSCNMIVPQLFWFKKVRQNLVLVFIMSIFINIGMWFERFVIVVVGLYREFMPRIAPKAPNRIVNSYDGGNAA